MQVKSTAVDLGMSANEYINELVDISTKKKFFGSRKGRLIRKSNKKTIYEAFWRLANMSYERKPMGVNEDDKIIYGIEDDK